MASVAVKKCLRQKSKRGAYKVYTDKDRYSIGKYASFHRVAASVTAWKKTYPNRNESTVRGFKKRHEAKLKEASRKNVSPKKKLANKMSGRPTLLGQKLDTLVQKFLRATRLLLLLLFFFFFLLLLLWLLLLLIYLLLTT